ncbi:MAG: hypothetical protein ACKOXK_07385 [Chakrabartia sp.]
MGYSSIFFLVRIGFVLTALLAGSAMAQDADRPAPSAQYAQMIIERRTVIRITPHEERARLQLSFGDWREKSAPKCFPVALLSGIVISKPDSIDMVLRGGRLIRARLEKGCPSIDFYSGFYLKPTSDGLICEDRDTIHSRTGGACMIDKFRTLVPPRR